MPTTGVCLLPPSTSQIPLSQKLISHLSRNYPEREHFPFNFDHRLYGDTSSQLPGSDTSKRAYTHLLKFSHSPQSAFVCSTQAGKVDENALVTIPVQEFGNFATLLNTKMQALWYPRQVLGVENGVSVTLEIGLPHEKELWQICIGDARIASKSGSTTGTGTLRGTLIEIFRHQDPINTEVYTRELQEEDAGEFQAVLQHIFKGAGVDDVMNSANFFTARTKLRAREGAIQTDSESQSVSRSEPDYELAKLYMNLLRR